MEFLARRCHRAGDPRGAAPDQRRSPWRYAGGGYWTRTNDPEIDLVGADRAPIAQRISFAGSIKWRDNHFFDSRDLAELIVHRSQLPGADESTPLLAISRAGTVVDGPVTLLPEDLLAGWQSS